MTVNVKQQVAQFIGFFAAFALALFLPAGTVAWLAGWIFLGLFFSFFLATNLWLARNNPGFVRERRRLGTSDQQGGEQPLFPLLLAAPFAWLVFMYADSLRFRLSPVP